MPYISFSIFLQRLRSPTPNLLLTVGTFSVALKTRKSGSAGMVAQSYSNYMAWKDSTNALKHADEIKALKQQIADNEASIAEKDSSLTTRWVFIVGLLVLAGFLAAALVVGAVILMRYILLTRRQKKNIQLANENNALKAKFISNISAQLEPTFRKLDSRQPEVQALLDFSEHIQILSELENSSEPVELEDVQVKPVRLSVRSVASTGATEQAGQGFSVCPGKAVL